MTPSKTYIIFIILDIDIYICIFNLAGSSRFEKPLRGVYLITDSSYLAIDLMVHSLPCVIQSLILLRSSLPASLITSAKSYSLIISLDFVLKWPSCFFFRPVS